MNTESEVYHMKGCRFINETSESLRLCKCCARKQKNKLMYKSGNELCNSNTNNNANNTINTTSVIVYANDTIYELLLL